jgi:hypothetical protein
MMQLVPFAQKPYYSFVVQTQQGSAKFVFIAANAWNSAQQSWLENELSQATSYTFVMRHEPPGDTSSPGAGPTDSIISAHPLTIGFYGHSHEYRHVSANQVIVGNGGAPLSSTYYGFLYVVQRPDGNVSAQSIRADTGAVADSWVVTPKGGATH